MPDDPYARQGDGTETSMGAMTADDLRAAHRRIFNRDTLQVAVVGDISAAELGLLLDEIFGGLPASAPREALPPARIATGPKQQVIDRDMPQSVIVFGHEGILRDDPDFIPAFVMSEILGGGGLISRLASEIREKRGLTYGVSFGLSPMERAGLYAGMLQTRNESAGEALAVIREVLAKMAAGTTFPVTSSKQRYSENRSLYPLPNKEIPPYLPSPKSWKYTGHSVGFLK